MPSTSASPIRIACLIATVAACLLSAVPAAAQHADAVHLTVDGRRDPANIPALWNRQTVTAAPEVVIVTTNAAADAMAAAPLVGGAGLAGAAQLVGGGTATVRPLIGVPADGGLTPAARNDIVRMGARSALIVGGTAAVAAQVDRDLDGLGIATTRLAGANRIHTAQIVAQWVIDRTGATTLFLSDADTDVRDVAGTGPWAAQARIPVLLVAGGPSPTTPYGGRLAPQFGAFLLRNTIDQVLIAGEVHPGTLTDLSPYDLRPTRIGAANDPAVTAVEANRSRGIDRSADTSRLAVVDNASWLEPAAAMVHVAAFNGAIVTTDDQTVPDATATFTSAPSPATVTCGASVHPDACAEVAGTDPTFVGP